MLNVSSIKFYKKYFLGIKIPFKRITGEENIANC